MHAVRRSGRDLNQSDSSIWILINVIAAFEFPISKVLDLLNMGQFWTDWRIWIFKLNRSSITEQMAYVSNSTVWVYTTRKKVCLLEGYEPIRFEHFSLNQSESSISLSTNQIAAFEVLNTVVSVLHNRWPVCWLCCYGNIGNKVMHVGWGSWWSNQIQTLCKTH